MSGAGARAGLRRWMRDPLLRFLVAGALIYGAHAAAGGGGAGLRAEIHLDREAVRGIAERWRRQRGRAPDRRTLRGLVQREVEERLLLEEALALGLHRGDRIVRRHLAAKMAYLVEPGEPDEADLRAFLAANAHRFRRPARMTFRQRFIDADRRGAAGAARALLARLRGTARPGGHPRADARGDTSLLPARMTGATPAEIDARFGPGFAARLAKLPPGAWGGPVSSAFGLHLVRVEASTPSRPARLDEVRAAVREALIGQRREAARRALLARLRRRYPVHVDWPPTAAAPPARASR